MNKKTLLTLALSSCISVLLINPQANANYNRHGSYVNYDLLCQSADGLQRVAYDLKDCFAADFRHTGYYGKLVSRSSKIGHQAKKLYRKGLSKSSYSWRSEIQKLDDLVCDLDALVDRAYYESRGRHSIHPKTLRKVRLLQSEAGRYINALERSLRKVDYIKGPSYNTPRRTIIQEPIRFDDVAPGYAPAGELSRRSYRPSYRGSYTRRSYGKY